MLALLISSSVPVSSAIIASCVRIAYVRAMLNNRDVLYTQGSAAVWSAVEINIGILCNCLAMLKPFVRRHMPWLKSLIGVRSAAGDGYHFQKNSSAAAATALRRDNIGRGSNGMYELYSVGRDRAFGFGVGKVMGTEVEARDGSDSGSGNEETGWVDEARQRGILVTTTVVMGRSSEGDLSTEDILTRGRIEDSGAIATETRVGSAWTASTGAIDTR